MKSSKMLDILADITSKSSKTLIEDKKENGECDGNQNNAILLNGTLKEAAVEEERKPRSKVPRVEPKQPADFGSHLRIIKMNEQVRELQTILRDK